MTINVKKTTPLYVYTHRIIDNTNENDYQSWIVTAKDLKEFQNNYENVDFTSEPGIIYYQDEQAIQDNERIMLFWDVLH